MGAREQAQSVALRTYRADFHTGNGLMLTCPRFQVACRMCFCVPSCLPLLLFSDRRFGKSDCTAAGIPRSSVGRMLGHFLDCITKASYICPS
jgi:hypothetical protein